MSFLSPLLKDPHTPHVLQHAATARVVARHLETAFDSDTRRRGLLGREGLLSQSALIIAPTGGIHTFFMRFTIDVVFVSKDGLVLTTYSSLRPWRIGLSLRGFAAIELPEHTIRDCGLQRGDRLVVVPHSVISSVGLPPSRGALRRDSP